METTETYHVHEIEAWASRVLPRTGRGNTRSAKSKASNASLENGRAADFEAVRAGCSFVDGCATNPRMDEPSWHALASIAGYCESGEDVFHEISALDARYDEGEASEKLTRATAEAKPRSCTNIRETIGHSGCETCPFSGKVNSPIALGYRTPEVVALMKDHVMETETGRYLDLRTGIFSSTRAFNDRYSHITKDVSPHTKLSKDNLTRKVQVAAYLPGTTDLFHILHNGQEAVNLWKPSRLKPSAGACDIILGHFQLMFPDNTVHEHFLNALAFMVQRPGRKIGHAFILIGKQGTGKSLLFGLIKKLLGEQNCRTIESNSLGMRFNAHMANVQALIIEELWTAERRETYNGIKTLVTARMMTVEEKNIPVFEARTPDFILGTSNHDVPITVEDGDRRFGFYESPMEGQSAEYYGALARAIDEEAGAFLYFLLMRDIASFDPNKAPPVTDTKREIVSSSRSQVAQEVAAMIEENDIVFWREMVNLNDVRAGLAKRLNKTPSLNEVKSALKATGAVNLGVVRLTPTYQAVGLEERSLLAERRSRGHQTPHGGTGTEQHAVNDNGGIAPVSLFHVSPELQSRWRDSNADAG